MGKIHKFEVMSENKFKVCRKSVPISVVAQSKTWVCGRSLAGITDSNPTGGMDVFLL